MMNKFMVSDAEIEKARREGREEREALRQEHIEAIRADERERIAIAVKDRFPLWDSGCMADLVAFIRAGKPPEPKPLEKVQMVRSLSGWQDYVTTTVNALVDAVNELRSLPPLGTRLAGGTKIGNAVTLPNGGTWERIQ
jgi:hypothetical protein